MGQYLKLFKQQLNGLDFSFGYSFQAIPDVFGFKFFDGYSSYQSLSSRSFSTSTTLGPSIANGPYLTYCSIPFQELNLMVLLVNLKTLHHFNGIDSIIIWWHVKLLDTKNLSAKRATRSTSAIIHYCPMAHISPTAPIILGYQTYVTFHDTSMEDIILDSDSSMPMTLYFAICKYLCPEIVFSSLPRQPPDGIFTAFIISVFIGFIFGAMTIRTCFKLSFYSLWNYLVAEIKATVRHIDRPIESKMHTDTHHVMRTDTPHVMRTDTHHVLWHTNRLLESNTTEDHTIMVDGDHFPWHDGFRSFISLLALIIYCLPRTMPTTIPRSCIAIMYRAHIFSVRARILLRDTVFYQKFMIQRISCIIRESMCLLRELLKYF